jgi:GT2 family glycosyltransferase
MLDRPDVSICIVNWNGRELLRNLLASLRDAEPDITLQTIVIDNASSDDSPDMVAGEFPEVILKRNSRNFGFSVANNQAADQACGRYLLFLNNDTLVPRGSLGRLVAFMDQNPRYSAVGPKLLGDDGNPQQTGRNLPTLGVLLYQRMQLFPRWTGLCRQQYQDYRYGGFDPQRSGEARQLAAAALLVRREAFDAAGRWDEQFEFGVEDVDLCLRLGRVGPIYYMADAMIHHLGRISSRANRGFVYTGYECGYARYLAKHHHRSTGRLYKAMITLDMPVRLFVLGTQTVGYVMLGRKDAASRTYQRLSAAGEFFFHRLPKFWSS